MDTSQRYIYSACYMQVCMFVHFSISNPSRTVLSVLSHISYHILSLPGEWITGSVCMYLARYLAAPDTSNLMVREYEQQIFHCYQQRVFFSFIHLQLVDLLKRVEFIIVPVANPDGYYVSLIK